MPTIEGLPNLPSGYSLTGYEEIAIDVDQGSDVFVTFKTTLNEIAGLVGGLTPIADGQVLANLSGISAIPIGHSIEDLFASLPINSGVDLYTLIPATVGGVAVQVSAIDIASLTGGGLTPIPNGNVLANLSGITALPIAHTIEDLFASLPINSGVDPYTLIPASVGGAAVQISAWDIAHLLMTASFSSGVDAHALVPVSMGGVTSLVFAGDIAALGGGGLPSGGTTAQFLRGDAAWSSTLVGPMTADAFVPASSTVPTNGLYLKASNALAWATNSTQRMTLNATGVLSIGGSTVAQTWLSTDFALEFSSTSSGPTGAVYCKDVGGAIGMGANFYIDSGGNYHNAAHSNGSTIYEMTGGSASEHRWFSDTGITSGATFTPTQLMTLAPTGTLTLVGKFFSKGYQLATGTAVTSGMYQSGTNVINWAIGSVSVMQLDGNSSNRLTISGPLTIASAVLMTTTTTLTNGAAAALGTLTNAPAAGNPTKWVPINDNGTTRYIPAW